MRTIRLLVDGYNVLFQSQLVGKGRGRDWLPHARERLLKHIAACVEPANQARTTIVFDAAKYGESPADFHFNDGIEVRFAKEHDEADDLLELLIRQAPQPKLLQVVSSDLRIRRCAMAKRANSINAESFLKLLDVGRIDELFANSASNASRDGNALHREELDEKEQGTRDVDYWLREFDC